MIDWQRRGRREELDERGGRPSHRAHTARVDLVLERKREREKGEGGWEEKGKQREGVRYLNARAGQHRRSSELPQSEGRTGRGSRRTELYSFPDSQAHTLIHINIAYTNTHRRTNSHTHTFGLSTHLWTPKAVFWNSTCASLAPTHHSPQLFTHHHSLSPSLGEGRWPWRGPLSGVP